MLLAGETGGEHRPPPPPMATTPCPPVGRVARPGHARRLLCRKESASAAIPQTAAESRYVAEEEAADEEEPPPLVRSESGDEAACLEEAAAEAVAEDAGWGAAGRHGVELLVGAARHSGFPFGDRLDCPFFPGLQHFASSPPLARGPQWLYMPFGPPMGAAGGQRLVRYARAAASRESPPQQRQRQRQQQWAAAAAVPVGSGGSRVRFAAPTTALPLPPSLPLGKELAGLAGRLAHLLASPAHRQRLRAAPPQVRSGLQEVACRLHGLPPSCRRGRSRQPKPSPVPNQTTNF